MFDRVKFAATQTYNHVNDRRGRYAALATAGVAYAISRKSVHDWNEFLAEHNLTEQFYRPE